MSLVIFVTAYLSQIARGELLATTSSFTATDVYATSDGSWTAAMTCNFVFPGKSVSTGNTAHVYTRFGVPITSYKDYLGGAGPVETDPEGRWVIAVVGYSLQDSLSYGLEFTYTRWLGANHPEGDCRLYSSLQEAVDVKDIEDTDTYFGFPETTAADPLIANASIFIGTMIAFPGLYSLQAWCYFSFPGLKYGLNEAYVIINYGMETVVGSYSDYQSNTILEQGLTGEFTVAQMYFASADTSDFLFNVETTESPSQMDSNGNCLLYAREADVRSMVETLYEVSQVSLTPGVVGSTSTTVSPTYVPPTSAVQPALTTSVQSDATTDSPESTTVGPESTTTNDGPESTITTDDPESTTSTGGPEFATTGGPESATITGGLVSTDSTGRPEFTTADGPEPIAIISGLESTRSTGSAESTTTTLPHVLVSFHRSTNTGSWMREYQEARGRAVDGVVLWRKGASTCLHGARLCSADPACVAIRCNLVGGTSKGFSSVSKIGDRSAQTDALFVFE